jgi:hypothetical protein
MCMTEAWECPWAGLLLQLSVVCCFFWPSKHILQCTARRLNPNRRLSFASCFETPACPSLVVNIEDMGVRGIYGEQAAVRNGKNRETGWWKFMAGRHAFVL